MRHSLGSAALLVLVPVLAGCSSGSSLGPAHAERLGAAGAPGSSSSAPADPEGTIETTCAEVRAGIDAFNTGDFESTAAHFRDAVPLAEGAADNEPSQEADLLLEAVVYYADLAPDDYPAASVGSADFARYKMITLGLCASDDPPGATEPPGTDV